jgi:transposase-like protein
LGRLEGGQFARKPQEMNGEIETSLSPKQYKAIAALLSEDTIEEAAETAGVNPTTLHRWLKQSAFQAEYRAERRRFMERAVGALQAASTKAVEALVRNLDSGVASVEVRAASAILDRALKGIELYDIIERLEALEEIMEN